MFLIFKIFILFSVVFRVKSYCDSKIVTTEQGLLRGFRYPNREYFAFMSVPFAISPPGRDRFKPPLPAPAWMGIFDAVETGTVCPQSLPLPKIREDCLIANIFVPDTNVTNLPVMVHVHGGAFVITSGDYFRFTKLVGKKRAIVVTFNYRLGVHGFLCLGTKNIPGNAGLKDQIALLRWVQRNIAAFGGNPGDVTLVGCGSGGSSIDLLSLSPAANGLFHKIIIESGSSIGVTNIQLDPVANAKIYAKLLNFTDIDNIDALEEFYMTASYELLTSETDKIIYRDDSVALFVPCIEKNTGTGDEMVITESPWTTLERGKYQRRPMLIGYAELEASLKLDEFERVTEKMNMKFSDFLPGDLQFSSEEEKEIVANKVKTNYFGQSTIIDEKSILDYGTYFSDVLFIYPIMRNLKLRQKAGNETIYFFEYSFVDEYTNYLPHTNESRAGHCSFIDAAMDHDHIMQTDQFEKMKDIIRNLTLDFISTGVPVPEETSLSPWLPVKSDWFPYMSFSNGTLILKPSVPQIERAQFWVPIYDKYRRDPIPPSNSSISQIHFGLFLVFIPSFYFLILL